MTGPKQLSDLIIEKCSELGFSDAGIVSAGFLDAESGHFREWLSKGYAADMNYMLNNAEKRTDPRLLFEGCRSVIVVLLNYRQKDYNSCISEYACGDDYHQVLKNKLEILKRDIGLIAGKEVQMKTFADTKPVMEKAWAVRAGLGWQGRNCLVVNPDLGTKIYIGGILTDLELEPVVRSKVRTCGNCRKCIDACPTAALDFPGSLNSVKCIAYQTIENKGSIPDEIASKMTGSIYGCEICQNVCPWNERNAGNISGVFLSRPFTKLSPEEWIEMTEEEFQLACSNTNILRTGLQKMKDNATIVVRNKK